MRAQTSLFFFLCLAALLGASRGHAGAVSLDPSPRSSQIQVGHIFFDSGLTPKERGAFSAALDYLREHELLNADPALLQIMKLEKGDHDSVRSWIENRVQYIVNESNAESKLSVDENPFSFENPGLLPPSFKDNANAGAVMSNVGVLLYLVGKSQNTLVTFAADHLGLLKLTSPRAGLLTIGEDFFMLPPEEKTPVKIFHLTTMIHEARHSDGNKESTGFLHAVCPSGDYEGIAACDHNSNGPYEIESLAMEALRKSCVDCSRRGRAILDVLYADTQTRQIKDENTSAWDDNPEGRRVP